MAVVGTGSVGLVAGSGEALGGTAGGNVRAGGEVWCVVGGADLVAAMVAGVVAEYEPRHPIAGLRFAHSGTLAAKAGREQLLRAAAR